MVLNSQSLPSWSGRVLIAVLLGAILFASPMSANAREAAAKARQGMMWVRWKKCDKAIPLLEEAELLRHQPHVALALADCYLASGKLMDAVEIYRVLVDEKITNRHSFQDRTAIKNAPQRLLDAEARIPTLAFEAPVPYENLEVLVNGKLLDDPFVPRQVTPDAKLVIVARAKGYEEFYDDVTLAEGEHLVRPLKLLESPPKPTKRRAEASDRPSPSDGAWFGLRGRGYVVPSFMWRMFGEGGRTVMAPGGALTWTNEMSDADLMLSLGYASYGVGPTPFKGKDAPDTDWEIIESDLHAAYLTTELSWRTPLSEDRSWEFFWGGGIGIGWTFAGNIKRTQAFPLDLRPGDPYNYQKCAGPNDPPGSYLYCNQLDHDANHYDYDEPNWFAGGKRPLIYPWLAFPQLGISYKPSQSTAIDLEVGVTTGGLLLGLGARGR
jgi:hypothetical protein